MSALGVAEPVSAWLGVVGLGAMGVVMRRCVV